MRALLHICCAGCALGAFAALREERIEAEGYFYNPNIHPLLEFRKRIKALKVSLERETAPVRVEEHYGLEEYLAQIYRPDRAERCRACYTVRLRRTAHMARERSYDAFTTTLLISPHQAHETVREVGEAVGREEGVPFLYRDFRPCFAASQEEAKRRQVYRQSYCGCIVSEYERYKDTTREVYRGTAPAVSSGEDRG